jgi:hypothetical protein
LYIIEEIWKLSKLNSRLTFENESNTKWGLVYYNLGGWTSTLIDIFTIAESYLCLTALLCLQHLMPFFPSGSNVVFTLNNNGAWLKYTYNVSMIANCKKTKN